MMKEPWFWRDRSIAGRAVAISLTPGAFLYDAARRFRIASARSAPAPVPVFCIGNATLGGVGKTPFALMLRGLLAERGIEPHFLTRGFGGALKGPVQADPSVHDAMAVGDEALLLAAVAPTVVSRDRPAGARLAAETGAEAIIMDDGYQNPTIEKTASILLIDAADPYGNGRVFPAGPLREPASDALARADLTVFVLSGAEAPAPESDKPAAHVWLEPQRDVLGARLYAFCGIGAPERFFTLLKKSGADLAGAAGFADHHRFAETEIAGLKRLAAEKGARLITTEKDFVRLPPSLRDGIEVFPVRMVCRDPDFLRDFALSAIARFKEKRGADG